MEIYHKELFEWAIERIELLEKAIEHKQSVIDVFMSGVKNDGDY
jgi:hypothetical protein